MGINRTDKIYYGTNTTTKSSILQDLSTAAKIQAVIEAGTIEILNCQGIEALDLTLMNTSAATNTGTLVIIESRDEAFSKILKQQEIQPGADLTIALQQRQWGLSASAEKKPKALKRRQVSPGSFVIIGYSAVGAGAWYTRVQMIEKGAGGGGGGGSDLTNDDGNLANIETAVQTSATNSTTLVASTGALTDTPLGGETAEGATARSGISLWKRVVNKLIELKTLLGAGATSLLKLEDTAHANGDAGVMMFGVRRDDAQSLVDADGDYSPLIISEHGCLNIDPQHYKELCSTDSVGDWTVLGNDTVNLATSTNHVFGTNSLEFDKVDGAANTVFAGIRCTITAISANKYMEEGGGFLLCALYLSSVADVNYGFVRLGTDS